MVNINVIKLNVDILNITKISDLPDQYRIKEIHPDAFNGFINLEEIDFYMTNINKIHANTFNEISKQHGNDFRMFFVLLAEMIGEESCKSIKIFSVTISSLSIN